MKCINHNHLKFHGLDMISFKQQFPNYETHSEELKLKNKESSKKGIDTNNKSRKIEAKNNLLIKIKQFNLLEKKCKQCNDLLLYKREQGEFCNRSCSAQYYNKNRIINFTKEGKQKQRESGFKNIKNFDEYQQNRPKPKIICKVCEICKNNFEVGHKKKLNRTCSKECRSQLYSQTNIRENNTYGKYGYYKGIYCASSWELAFLITHLDLGNSIKRCELNFTYLMKDIQHTYFPDFFMDGIIYEVKGYEKEDVKLKTQAVINAGYKIEVIRRKEILPMIKAIKEKYGIKNITELYDKNIEKVIDKELVV